jgi:glycosyltransferase involved in cell wall biosynthesis
MVHVTWHGAVYNDPRLKLIIQIPAYNEEATLGRALADLPKRIEGIDVIETLVIDDGSDDRTTEVARAAGATHVLRLLSNRGLAAAFMAGIDEALRRGADIIVNTDADNQYKGADVAKLVEPILAGRAEVVIGDRDVRNSPYMSPMKRLLQRLGSMAVGVVSGIDVGDATSGFRAFSRDAAYQLNVFNPFTYTLETIIQAGHRNLRVESVKIGTNPPTRSSRLYRGMFSYVRKSVVTIFRVYTVYRPLKTFFAIGSVLFGGGVLIGLRFLFHYLHGNGGGHIQSLILGSVLLLSGFQTMLVGLVADLISVNRRLSEDLRIRIRRGERNRSGGEHRRPRERSAPPKRQHTAQERKVPESQWVWLGEKPEREATNPPATATASGEPRKRRRRRRPERRPVHADRHPHHEPPDHDDK